MTLTELCVVQVDGVDLLNFLFIGVLTVLLSQPKQISGFGPPKSLQLNTKGLVLVPATSDSGSTC